MLPCISNFDTISFKKILNIESNSAYGSTRLYTVAKKCLKRKKSPESTEISDFQYQFGAYN